MRIAVISDTHFGDEHCTLVGVDRQGTPEIGPAYRAFKNAVGHADYLILLGDIFDFSVTSYENAYEQAKIFFKKVQEDNLVKQLIYIPGNHDYDIWHTVEHQVNVINQLFAGVELQYSSGRKSLGYSTASPFVVTNLTFHCALWNHGIEISGGLYNLLDAKYADPGSAKHVQELLDQDGQRFGFQLRYRF